MCKMCDTDRADEQSIFGRLRSIYASLIYQKELSACMRSLEDTLLNKEFSKEEQDLLVRHMKQSSMLDTFQPAYETYETDLEHAFAKDLTSNKVDGIESYALFGRFEQLIDSEIKLSDIGAKDSVLFIGSGPFPISAILLSQYSGCRVDCYDSDADAVHISSKVIGSLGLDKDISIYNQDGRDLADTTYDAVVIALLAKPKEAIFKTVRSRLKENGKIICRDSKGVHQAFYKPTDRSLVGMYNLCDTTLGSGYNPISSLLFR